jgi:hypothetical protein
MLSQQVWRKVWPAVKPNNNVDQVSCASEGNKKPDRLYVLEADMDFKSNSLLSYLQADNESILDSELNFPATEAGSENVPISIWLFVLLSLGRNKQVNAISRPITVLEAVNECCSSAGLFLSFAINKK